jgi:hypothetical protein
METLIGSLGVIFMIIAYIFHLELRRLLIGLHHIGATLGRIEERLARHPEMQRSELDI